MPEEPVVNEPAKEPGPVDAPSRAPRESRRRSGTASFFAVFFGVLFAGSVLMVLGAMLLLPPEEELFGRFRARSAAIYGAFSGSERPAAPSAALASLPRNQRVMITKAVTVQLPTGETTLAVGTRAALVSELGGTFHIDHDGYVVPVPATSAVKY